jgi:hypothetical protein
LGASKKLDEGINAKKSPHLFISAFSYPHLLVRFSHNSSITKSISAFWYLQPETKNKIKYATIKKFKLLMCSSLYAKLFKYYGNKGSVESNGSIKVRAM